MPKDINSKVSISSILLTINLVILFLPMGGIYLFRFYEGDLVRQTESELISQAAVISSIYEKEIKKLTKGKIYGRLLKIDLTEKNKAFAPISPSIDLFDKNILPPRPDGMSLDIKPDPIAWDAGSGLSEILKKTQRFTLAGLNILDYNGVVVANTSSSLGLSFAHVPEVISALNGQYNSVLRERIWEGKESPALASISRGTGIRIFVAFPIIYNEYLVGVVYLSRTPKSILKHFFNEKFKYISLGILILFLTVFIAVFTSRTISRPIRELAEIAKKVASGNKKGIEPLSDPVTKEVESLSKNISTMAQTLQQKSEYIQKFATNLSHEFKTPLTSIQGAIELIYDHYDDMSVEKRNHFLNNILSDTKRLKKLVMRLLELAKAENVDPTGETSNIGEVISKIKGNLVFDRFDIDSEKMSAENLKISSDNLELILRNLLRNSIEHGASKVELSSKKSEKGYELIIFDNGQGISKGNREKIFTAFFTTKREKGGTGLGLDIVKSILISHGGDIRLLESNQGAKFNLLLPIEFNKSI